MSETYVVRDIENPNNLTNADFERARSEQMNSLQNAMHALAIALPDSSKITNSYGTSQGSEVVKQLLQLGERLLSLSNQFYNPPQHWFEPARSEPEK